MELPRFGCCCRIPNSVHTELVSKPQTAVFTTANYLSTNSATASFLWTDSAIQPTTFTRPLVALPLVRN